MTEPVDSREFEFSRDINFAVSEAIYAAPANPDKAAEVLMLTARLLRSGEPIPAQLAQYLADAFEASMVKPLEIRAKSLTLELNLTALNRRPNPFDWFAAFKLVALNEGKTEAELKALIMKQAGCGATYAADVLKLALNARANYDALKRSEMPDDPIPQ